MPQDSEYHQPVQAHVKGEALAVLNQDGTLATRALPTGTITAVAQEAPPAPSALAVRAAPNPFNPTRRVWLELLSPMAVVLEIYDARGRRVRE